MRSFTWRTRSTPPKPAEARLLTGPRCRTCVLRKSWDDRFLMALPLPERQPALRIHRFYECPARPVQNSKVSRIACITKITRLPHSQEVRGCAKWTGFAMRAAINPAINIHSEKVIFHEASTRCLRNSRRKSASLIKTSKLFLTSVFNQFITPRPLLPITTMVSSHGALVAADRRKPKAIDQSLVHHLNATLPHHNRPHLLRRIFARTPPNMLARRFFTSSSPRIDKGAGASLPGWSLPVSV